MDLKQVLFMARTEMDRHKLTNWKVVLFDSKSRAGEAEYIRWDLNPERSYGIIRLSRDYMSVFEVKDALETILHEIAHALDSPKNKAHGPEWKAIAKRIGSTGSRCVPRDAPRPKAKYRGVCPNGYETQAHRL